VRFAVMVARAIFESEEKARARESDPRRDEGVQALRASLADVLAGAPEYTDLDVLAEVVPQAAGETSPRDAMWVPSLARWAFRAMAIGAAHEAHWSCTPVKEDP
jgi:hypothetical protein